MRKSLSLSLAAALAAAGTTSLHAQHHHHNQAEPQAQNQPWMNTGLSPDERADMVLKEMTLDEKIDLVHGNGMPGWGQAADRMPIWAMAARVLCSAWRGWVFR